MERAINVGQCELIIDEVEKDTYVLHEGKWNFTTDWHSHHKGQLLYVERGMQYLHTEKETFLLPAHHCAWIPPDLRHKTSSPSAEGFFRSLFFTFNHIPEFFAQTNVFKVPNVLREMILYTERWSQLRTYDVEEATFLAAIVNSLPNFCSGALPLMVPVSQHPQLIPIMEHLVHSLAEDINLIKVAEKFSIAPRTLQRLFQKEMGMSMAHYIKTARIIKSVELLSEKGQNVSSVAYKVGYESLPTFSNNFLKIIGRRPQEFLNH
ncbi:AraC family transcriptional regulator [Flavobacterium sp. '19STA2R22 D10 B1']|uniref:AraC family transcriptional regulator n=1 Tax=Flavobacterium aerium TaxID=3037261 RepID=UPI00278C5584|nr:helix-turn-helix transcriptional regulator [Flavobacterium sp. '19STA2R22 D10 B1']